MFPPDSLGRSWVRGVSTRSTAACSLWLWPVPSVFRTQSVLGCGLWGELLDTLPAKGLSSSVRNRGQHWLPREEEHSPLAASCQ